jgi:hypothetical protein
MQQNKTGADSLNYHRLQSLFAFWARVYRRSIAIHIMAQQYRTTGDVVSLASFGDWGEQLIFSGVSQGKI